LFGTGHQTNKHQHIKHQKNNKKRPFCLTELPTPAGGRISTIVSELRWSSVMSALNSGPLVNSRQRNLMIRAATACDETQKRISPAQPTLSASRLIAALPQPVVALLEFSHTVLAQGHVCLDAGDPIEEVYFPCSGLISLVAAMEKGDVVEAGMVGCEGAVGLQSAVGRRYAFTRAIVQIPGTFYTVSAEALRRVVETSPEAQVLVAHYTDVLLAEAQQLAACNAIHPALARLTRLLLKCADRVGSEQFPLTQDFLAEMLGVRRTTVTLLARDLQGRRMIRYSRGKIAIIDRRALESCACECYGTIKALYDELGTHNQRQALGRAPSGQTELRAPE
jgi:CRP-like cAMP-binding protein